MFSMGLHCSTAVFLFYLSLSRGASNVDFIKSTFLC